MISLRYSCACGFATGVLNDAQDHANATEHHVQITGFMTANKAPVADLRALEERARTKARENEIMRRARDRGLLKKA